MASEVGTVGGECTPYYDVDSAQDQDSSLEEVKEASGPQTSFEDRQKRSRIETISSIGISQCQLAFLLVKYGNNPDGVPALLYAIKQNDLEAVRVLLDCGASLQTATYQGLNHSPMNVSEYAAAYGTSALLSLLDRRGVNFNTVYDPRTFSPIHVAAYYNNTVALKFLIAKRISLYTPYYKGLKSSNVLSTTPVIMTIEGNSVESFKMFL